MTLIHVNMPKFK